MSINKSSLQRPITDLIANSKNSRSAAKTDSLSFGSKEAQSDSVLTKIKPEIADPKLAENLGQDLIRQLSKNPDKALGASGGLDESRVKDLLKD